MSFSSVEFFLFVPLVFALHWAWPSRSWQNAVLLVASYVFYSWWDYRFCALILISSLVDYFAGLLLERTRHRRTRQRWVGISLALNLGILGLFKYFNFFADSLVIAMAGVGVDVPAPALQILLPVGISFYTFQTMSYTIDVYRGAVRAERNWVRFMTFVSFFPQLVAGPIERAAHLLPQFSHLRRFSYPDAIEGCRYILWGLFKKMVIADNLAALVDRVYSAPETAGPAALAVATVFFAFQIYCDFSGYSDIALGTARLFGIRLVRNFEYPYFSENLTEFWRRWHISLSRWFRDYVYIPLGGREAVFERTARNLLLTFLLSGFWHGAAWTFLCWGLFHGLVVVVAQGVSEERAEKAPAAAEPAGARLPRAAALRAGRMIRTFLIVCLGWVLFRAESLSDAMMIYGSMLSGLISGEMAARLPGEIAASGSLWILILALLGIEWWQRTSTQPFPLPGFKPVRWAAYSALVWGIVIWGMGHTEPFIYFQF